MSEALDREGAREPVRGDAKTILAASTLPDAAKDLIAQVVRRTRLWRREKTAVASELVAHFEDGLERGRTADDMIASFGKVKTAARLIRRGKVRNRPLWWHVRRRLLQMAGVLLLCYAGLTLLLLSRQSTVSVDYLAQVDSVNQRVSPADCAWPIYRKAWIASRMWQINTGLLRLKNQSGGSGRFLRPGDTQWPQVVALLNSQRELLDAARAGGAKPSLGLSLKLSSYSAEDCQALFTERSGRPYISKDMHDALYISISWHLDRMQVMGQLVASDMRYAADTGDQTRVLLDYQALRGMAGQLSGYPFAIDKLHAVRLLALADEALLDAREHNPGVFAPIRVPLLHSIASTEPLFRVSAVGELDRSLDQIQRIYSDDGGGDGRITVAGLRDVVCELPSIAQNAAVLPMLSTCIPSRKELTNLNTVYYAAVEQDFSRPLWDKLRSPSLADNVIKTWPQSLTGSVGYRLMHYSMPYLYGPSLQADTYHALNQVTMTVLALDAYREKAGRYPASLVELVPQYLPAIPIDQSTGGRLCYKLADGKPLLYGLGKDGVDDGGIWTDKKTHWPGVPETGDWVLYPPVEE